MRTQITADQVLTQFSYELNTRLAGFHFETRK